MNDNQANKGYILVTPAKNEAKNLPDVAKCVLNQTIQPRLWVIVNDGSTDRTAEVIQHLMRQGRWIVGISMPEHERDVQFHYAEVCTTGFDFAVQNLEESGIDFDFMGLLDADTLLEAGYFEKLINKFEERRRLGLASGGLFHEKDGALVGEKSDKSSPRGTGRLWRKTCYFETGGYLACQAPPDAISNVKAKLLGYAVDQFQSIVAIQLRPTSSAESAWGGNERRGRAWHYLNAHPVLVLMNVILLTVERPRYRGVAFFLGYFAAFVRREMKIDDPEIREYFWRQRPREAVVGVIGRQATRVRDD